MFVLASYLNSAKNIAILGNNVSNNNLKTKLLICMSNCNTSVNLRVSKRISLSNYSYLISQLRLLVIVDNSHKYA